MSLLRSWMSMWRWSALGTAGGFVVFFLLIDNASSLFVTKPAAVPDSVSIARPPKPIVLFGMTVNELNVSQNEIKRDQKLVDLFAGSYVSQEVMQQLNVLPKNIFDFRRIAVGRKYTLISRLDSLHTANALVYEPNPIDYVIFHLSDSLTVEECKRDVTTVEKDVTGEIQSSLSQTIDQLGISHELTNKFVDIFAWVVDFQRLQKGDKFKLIYEENLVEERPISIGRVLGIYFEHFGKGYYAFPFDQGEGMDYFDEEGNSLRKALLKYPIEFTSISSRYNLNRFHPVAKVYRPHLGTDFAAPTGTPIRAVGDGTIEEARFSANNGNFVKIHHNGTYSTAYLHMSRIGSGISAGVRVRQGQTIGYVGSTGLATGPHVCYRFWRNGVQVDALQVELPPSQPVKQQALEAFQKVKGDLIQRLSKIEFPPPTAEVIVATN